VVTERRGFANESRRPADSNSAASARARRLLTLKDAAAYLGVSVWTVRDLVSKGKLPVVRLTRRLHFDRQDLDHMIDIAKDTE
jgi:excisionase family DNA binding protein